MGPKGLEPSPTGLKVRCAAVTPRPRNVGRAYAFKPCLLHGRSSSRLVVALRVELSTTRLSAASGQPALDYHLPTSLSLQSGRQDSNLRFRAPKARGSATTLHPVVLRAARTNAARRCPSRTRLCAWKGRDPLPDRRTSRVGAQSLRCGPGGARTLVSWSSPRRYVVSATSPTTKPGVAVTPGFSKPIVT